MQNQDFARFYQESEGHIRQAQNMKTQGGPRPPHLYIFQGW